MHAYIADLHSRQASRTGLDSTCIVAMRWPGSPNESGGEVRWSATPRAQRGTGCGAYGSWPPAVDRNTTHLRAYAAGMFAPTI
jgi:hypothetical protein